MIELLKKQLIRHEGYKQFPYTCSAGKTTIGVGHNLDDNGLPNHIIDALLDYDIRQAVSDVKRLFPSFDGQPEPIQIVLANMCFQLGASKLSNFVNFRARIDSREYDQAADEMLDSLWAKQTSKRANELAGMVRALVQR